MDGFIKILGVSVGMHESEAIKILSSQNIKIGKNANCIYTDGYAKFLGEEMQINFSLNESRISKITLCWTFTNKGKLNSREDDRKVYEVGKKLSDYILSMDIWMYNEETSYDGRLRINRSYIIDFYNKVRVSTQYKASLDSINAVLVTITDMYSENLDKAEFEFIRSKYVLENIKTHIVSDTKRKEENITKSIKGNNLMFKIAIIVILVLVGFLYIQNNRYYYTDKGRIRVDKWKNEWTRLNSEGVYVRPQ